MLNIQIPEQLIRLHVDSVLKRIRKDYREESVLNDVKTLGVNTIEDFLTADVDTLRSWVINDPGKLQFTWFKDIYSNYFSNGSTVYVSDDYNAYKFLEMLDINVCPYCDDEYLHNDLIKDSGRHGRTTEIDHFFPKSKYPALAMCIYNLVPSGQNCNGLKMQNLVGENPYEENIENDTWLYPDLEVGRLIDTVKPNECRINFHAKNGMKKNVAVLCLEQRYELHKNEVYEILRNKQMYTDEKIKEMAVILDTDEKTVYESIFGTQDFKEQRRRTHSKLKKDLLGF